MRKSNLTNTLILSIVLSTTNLLASSAGTSAGLTLVEAKGARSAALGEAFTAVPNDISAFGYNPATLGSLKNGQASFLFQKGVFEDSYGQIMMGSPYSKGGVGLSVSYYNGGDLQILEGTTEKTVSAQKDLNVSLGTSMKFNRASIGISAKYISSELAETAKANAAALDLGASLSLGSRLHWGVAVQNIGTKMKYIEQEEELPRIARTGLSFALSPKKMPTSFLIDGAYYLNEKELRPAAGIETWVGPLAIRAGYKGGSDLEDFTFGSGFILGPATLDYSFGLVDTLDARHMVSVSFQFSGRSTPALVKKPDLPETNRTAVVFENKEEDVKTVPTIRKHTLGSMANSSGFKTETKGVYIVQKGDSLASIAKKTYGNTKMWSQIYLANKHLLDDPEDLSVGQKINLP